VFGILTKSIPPLCHSNIRARYRYVVNALVHYRAVP
jgi:hypothetical protein